MINRIVNSIGSVPAIVYLKIATRFGGNSDADSGRVAARYVMIRHLFPRLLGPLAVGVAVAAVSDFGSQADISLYSTLAQVLPVLALAGFVELLPATRSVLLRVMEERQEEAPESDRKIVEGVARMMVYTFVGYLMIGEAGALWAVGTQRSTTFLVVVVCLSGALMVKWLTFVHMGRYEVFIDDRYSSAGAREQGGGEA